MSILLFIVILLLLIVGHEAGHFVAAKWARMKVLEFGVGFPPRMWGKKLGETEYTINWLPFGGFVKIFGEDDTDTGEAAMSSKSKLSQAAVLFAGPFANVFLGFVLLSFAFMVGVPAIAEEGALVRDVSLIVGEVIPGSPAEASGIRVGDRILSASTPEEFVATVATADGPIRVLIYQDGVERTVTLTPVAGLIEEEPHRKAIGIATALVGVKQLSFFDALAAGAVRTAENTWFVIVALFGLIAGALSFSADLSGIAGPVGIATMTGEAASFGAGALLSFAALLSLNLAVINLFPFPALDGGRLLFLGLETLTRRKIPVGIAGLLNTAGFALLILLMIAVTVGDVTRLLG